jgi:valyl-tRNA synthetase
VLSHLSDFELEYKPPNILPVDKWIIERTNETIIEASKWLNEYEVGMARKTIDDLFWKDLCDNYIEIAKERLYQPETHGFEERKSAQHAIYYCLFNILKMYAVYIPHIAEYIYQKGFRDFESAISIHLTEWEKPEMADADILGFGETLKQAVSEVRKFKTENNLSMRSEVDEAVISADFKYRQWFEKTEKDFVSCSHAKKIIYNWTN